MPLDDAALALDSGSLSPLPPVLKHGLPAIAVFGFLSFVSTLVLLVILAHRLFFKWRTNPHSVQHQFVFLIFNLLLADCQQAVAFMLNFEWVMRNMIRVGGTSCFVQGWFVSVGDLASGAWALVIGFHTFGSIALSYRISATTFYCVCAATWAFVYFTAILGVALYPQDIYVRAGGWCWVNIKYADIRLWAHYFWIFVAEFGTVVIYASLFLILRLRVRKQHFACPVRAAQAQQAAKLMVVYPAIYVVCTLPLASARMASLTGREASLTHMCLAGAMITSNGWLDVLVYTITRKVLLFSETAPEDSSQAEADIIDTFSSPFPFWTNRQHFGTTTTIEATPRLTGTGRPARSARGTRSRRNSRSMGALDGRGLVRQDSTELLFSGIRPPPALAVKAETTVSVLSEPMELNDIAGVTHAKNRMVLMEKERVSFDTKGSSDAT